MTTRILARWRYHRILVDQLRLFKPFSGRGHKLLFLSIDDQIAQAQIYPFFAFAREITNRFQIETRELPLKQFIAGNNPYTDVDAVCMQTWFDLSPQQMTALVEAIKTRWPKAKLIYFDWFAPTDLRYASVLTPLVDFYVKKHVLANRSA